MTTKERREKQKNLSLSTKFFECRYCDMYHPVTFTGTCRDKTNSFFIEEIIELEEETGITRDIIPIE